MEALPDWDLLAVVRSCRNTTTTTTTTTTTASPPEQPPLPPPKRENLCFSPTSVSSSSSSSTACSTSGMLFRFPNPFESTTTSFLSGQQDLQDICKPLICSTTTTTSISSCTTAVVTNSFQQQSSLSSPVSSSSSSLIAGRSFSIAADQTHLRRPIKPTSSQVIFGAPSATGISQGQRTKKRKNLMKKVCHVPAEGLSTDMWAWRKYGQKPIKGSPYPRGYYRCSSSKGCLARKQVERNRSDPKMFIVTYTSEHNHPMPTHRNSLAGSTRQKPDTPSPSAASLSPLTEKTEGEDLAKEENNSEDNDMGISDLMLNDDFYVGFEQIDGDDDGDSFSDQFSPSIELPWLSSNSGGTATAAGGS